MLGMGDENRQMNAWIWICSSQSYGLQSMNQIVSCRNCCGFGIFFIVLLSGTACRRKCFLWPMANMTSKG